MNSKLKNNNEESGLSPHLYKADTASHQKVITADSKVELPSTMAQAKTTPSEAPKDAHITFASATITISTPSIVIASSSPAEEVTNRSESEMDRYKKDLTTSFEGYEQQQEKLIAASYEKADGLLLTMGSGILALSGTFVGSLLSNKHLLTHLWELHLGWASLGITVASVLTSYFASRKSLFYSVETARSNKDSGLSEDEQEKESLIKRAKCYKKRREVYRLLTEGFNHAGAVAFIIGLTLIVMFAAMNIR